MNSLSLTVIQDRHARRFVELKPSEGTKFPERPVCVSIRSKSKKKYLDENGKWQDDIIIFGPCPIDSPDKVYFGPPIVMSSISPNERFEISAGGLDWQGRFSSADKVFWGETGLPEEELWITTRLIEPRPRQPKPPQPPLTPPPTFFERIRTFFKKFGTNIVPNLNTVLYGVMFVVLVIVLFLFATDVYNPNQGINEATQCPSDGAKSKTVFLIDGTNPISESFSQKLNTTCFARFLNAVPINGLLELRMISSSGNINEVLFGKCNTGEAEWRFEFRESLENAVGNLISTPFSSDSPIMQAIQSVSNDHFIDTPTSLSKQLVIVSDMKEETPLFSHSQGDQRYEKYTGSEARQEYQTELQGTDVEICLSGKVNDYQEIVDLINFWDQWFKENGGNLNRQSVN